MKLVLSQDMLVLSQDMLKSKFPRLVTANFGKDKVPGTRESLFIFTWIPIDSPGVVENTWV